MRGRVDWASLVAGLCLVAFGGLLLADARGEVEVKLVAMAPIACAIVGAILLASGLTRDRTR